MDDGSNEEGAGGWGEVRLLDVSAHWLRGHHGVDVCPQEQEVGEDINCLDETFSPMCISHFGCPSLTWERRLIVNRYLFKKRKGFYTHRAARTVSISVDKQVAGLP